MAPEGENQINTVVQYIQTKSMRQNQVLKKKNKFFWWKSRAILNVIIADCDK